VSPLYALVWTGICHGAFQLLSFAFSRLRGGPLDIVTLGAAQALAYTSGVFLVLHFHERGTGLRSSLGLRPTHPGLALIGVGLGMSLKIPAESMTALVEKYFPSSESDLLWRATLYGTESLADVAALLVISCLVAPWVEELLFRGALYGRLAKASPAIAGAFTGLLFVAVHPDPRHWPALLVVAAVLSHLRVASGSLLPCLGLHVAFNVVGVFSLVSGAASATRPLHVSSALLAASWLGAALLLFTLLKLADSPIVARARLEDRV
jgi:membrane protease YdiL (CAAX protease family)